MKKFLKKYIKKLEKEIQISNSVEAKLKYALFYHDHIYLANDNIGLKVLEYYNECIKQNFNPTLAHNNLASLYDRGNFVKQDYTKLIKHYKKAIECKDNNPFAYITKSIACENLGCCYYYGKGADKDYELALKYFEKGYNLSHFSGNIYKLGDCYLNGFGCKENKKKAFDFYNEALDVTYKYDEEPTGFFGKAEILKRLGKCYLFGYGIEKNINRAINYLEDAKELYLIDIDSDQNPYAKISLDETNDLLEETKSI